ncbi:aspartyl-phosphate phosphatase Spo0E family protein [Cytobacillus firmus]|nr:aspartyl-phosphate phosphatase Spo0E family protein [Cytobacillus firmus]
MNINTKKQKLLERLVEYRRKSMIKSINENGINHRRTIKLSEELDKLILRCQKAKV